MNSNQHSPIPTAAIGRSLRRTLWIGSAIASAFFVGFGGWASLAPLSGAAIASGVVSPEGNRRVVQHLEGGIVRKLLVRDGSIVTAGQPLVKLDANITRAKYDSVLKEYRTNLAKHARLIAERGGADDMVFPADEWGSKDSDVAREMFAAERHLFFTRLESREKQREILEQRIVQLQDQIAGYKAQIASQTRQLSLVREEAKGIRVLVNKGHERKPRLLALQRAEAEIVGARAGNKSAVARALSEIGEVQARIESLDSTHRAEVETQLSEVQAKLAKLREEMRAAVDVLNRTVITAPVSGTVMRMRTHTLGGVITAGEAILEIVPSGEELIINARISPTDVEQVHPGLAARVVLTGYSQRNMPKLEGEVLSVSADRLTDKGTGEVYYRARVKLPAEHVRKIAPHVTLKPGMPVEVMVVTAERTLLDYLIEPVTASFRKSFNEN